MTVDVLNCLEGLLEGVEVQQRQAPVRGDREELERYVQNKGECALRASNQLGEVKGFAARKLV